MKFPAQYRLIQSPNMVVQFDSLCSGIVVEGVNVGFRSEDWYPCDDGTKWELVGDTLPTDTAIEKSISIAVQSAPKRDPNNWCDFEIHTNENDAIKDLDRMKDRYPSYKFRLVERTTMVTDTVIHLPD